MIDTATVARALSRTLGGEWDMIQMGVFHCKNPTKPIRLGWLPDPRESTDVCLEMLHAAGYDLVPGDGEWRLLGHDKGVLLLPISGQPFRDDIIRHCAGEE